MLPIRKSSMFFAGFIVFFLSCNEDSHFKGRSAKNDEGSFIADKSQKKSTLEAEGTSVKKKTTIVEAEKSANVNLEEVTDDINQLCSESSNNLEIQLGWTYVPWDSNVDIAGGRYMKTVYFEKPFKNIPTVIASEEGCTYTAKSDSVEKDSFSFDNCHGNQASNAHNIDNVTKTSFRINTRIYGVGGDRNLAFSWVALSSALDSDAISTKSR